MENSCHEILQWCGLVDRRAENYVEKKISVIEVTGKTTKDVEKL